MGIQNTIDAYREKIKHMNHSLYQAVLANDTKLAALWIKQGATVAPEYGYGICLMPGKPLLVRL